MPDIVTLTINPSIDIFVNVGHVESTRKMRCSAPKRDPGGGGINVARVVHRLGGNVAAIYPTGGAIGQLLQRLVEREGISSLVTPSHVETRENLTAYEEESGEQFRFVLPGSRLHESEWQACLAKLAQISPAPKYVVASGSEPPGVPDDFFARVVRQAKTMGAEAIVDTTGAALAAVLKEGVAMIKPNLAELSEFVGASLDNDGDRIAACRKLVIDGRAAAVALTLGDQGALLVTASRIWRAQPMTIDVVSAVGAGDSFLGGMVAALAGGKPMAEAFRVAVAASTAAVMSPGTELSRAADVRRLLPQVQITEMMAALT